MTEITCNSVDLVGKETAMAFQRAGRVLDIARRSIVLGQLEHGPRLRLEYIPTKDGKLSRVEWDILAERVTAINEALDKDLVGITPGISTLQMKGGREAFEFLAPGQIDWDGMEVVREQGGKSRSPVFFSLGAQWFPPSMTYTLSKAQTDALAAAIALGGIAAIIALLGGIVLGPAALLVAAGLILQAEAFALARAASKTGQVMIKWSVLPFFYVIPLPV